MGIFVAIVLLFKKIFRIKVKSLLLHFALFIYFILILGDWFRYLTWFFFASHWFIDNKSIVGFAWDLLVNFLLFFFYFMVIRFLVIWFILFFNLFLSLSRSSTGPCLAVPFDFPFDFLSFLSSSFAWIGIS